MTHDLLIGLGNPGSGYAKNRHNVGFMAIDRMREDYGFGKESQKMGGLLSEGVIDGHKILTFKPQSYMNLSGEPAQRLVQFYKIPLTHITVLHDELDLAFTKLRIKRGGGHGGHNGLKSLDANIGPDYQRLRIGIGHPGDKDLVSDYVLADFLKEESKPLGELLKSISKYAGLLVSGQDVDFQNKVKLALDNSK